MLTEHLRRVRVGSSRHYSGEISKQVTAKDLKMGRVCEEPLKRFNSRVAAAVTIEVQ